VSSNRTRTRFLSTSNKAGTQSGIAPKFRRPEYLDHLQNLGLKKPTSSSYSRTTTIKERDALAPVPLLTSHPETLHGFDHAFRGHAQLSHHFSAGRAHPKSVDTDNFPIQADERVPQNRHTRLDRDAFAA
jgi:hypothetical protein